MKKKSRLPKKIAPIVYDKPNFVKKALEIILMFIIKNHNIYLKKYSFVFKTYIEFQSNFVSNKKTIRKIESILSFFEKEIKNKKDHKIILKASEQINEYKQIREKYKNFKRNPNKLLIKQNNFMIYIQGGKL
jgi:hypothetical protein